MTMANKTTITMNIDLKEIKPLSKNAIVRFFDGNENNWEENEEAVDSWSLDDKNVPEWLRQYL